MSSSQAKKKRTVAQVRREKEQRLKDLHDARLLSEQVFDEYDEGPGIDRLLWLLSEANRALELLRPHLEGHVGDDLLCVTASYGEILFVKARIQGELEHQTQALASYREAEDFMTAADRKGLLIPPSQVIRREAIRELGLLCLETHQLEAAKRYLLQTLAWPDLPIKLD